jgi:DNA-binding MarR family transcriptional regulator
MRRKLARAENISSLKYYFLIDRVAPITLHSGEMKTSERAILAPENLPYRMRLLVQVMGRMFQNVLDPFDITPLHWGILCCLWREDGLPTQAIANRLEQLGGTITVGLDSMEKRGLVSRKADLKDRRISRVWLKGRGRDLERELSPDVTALVGGMFECLSPRELSGLSACVDKLRAHLAASAVETGSE